MTCIDCTFLMFEFNVNFQARLCIHLSPEQLVSWLGTVYLTYYSLAVLFVASNSLLNFCSSIPNIILMQPCSYDLLYIYSRCTTNPRNGFSECCMSNRCCI